MDPVQPAVSPEQPSHEAEEKPRSTRARLIGIGLGAMALLALAAVGVVYYAYVNYLDPVALKRQLEEKAGQALGMPVSVAEVGLKWPAITVSGLRIGDPASGAMPLVEIGMAAATPDMFELLSGRVMLESVYVSSITGRLTREADGRLVLPGRPSTTPAPSGQDAVVAFDVKDLPLRQIEIDQVRFSLDDRASGKVYAAAMPRLAMKKSLLGTSLPIDTVVTVEELGTIAVKGELEPPEKLEVHVKLDNVEIAKLRGLLPPSVELPAGLGAANLSADVAFARSGALSVRNIALACAPDIALKGSFEASSLSPLNGSAAIALEPLPVKRLMELAGKYLPPMPDVKIDDGRLGGEVRLSLVDGTARDVTAWAKPQGLVVRHASLPAPLKLAQGAVRYDDGRVEWEKLSAEIRGIGLTSDAGKVTLGKKAAGSGSISIRMDISSVLSDFRKFLPKTVLDAKPEGTAAFSGTVGIDGTDVVLSGDLQGEKIRAIPAPGMAPVKLDRVRLGLTNVNATGGTIQIHECRADALGMSVHLSGSVKNGADPAFDLRASATADLATVKEALPIENELFKKQARLAGRVAFDASIGGTLKKPRPAGRLELKNVDLEIPSRGVKATDMTGVAEIDPARISIKDLKAGLIGGTIAISGSLSDYLAKPRVDASGVVQGVDLGEIRSLIARNVPAFPADLVFTGRADLDVAVKGPADEPDVSGNAVIAGGGLVHPAILRPLTGIVGPVKFDRKGLKTEGLQMSWGSSTVRLAGSIDDWAGFKLAFQYDVQPLDLTDIGAYFLAGTGYRAEGSGTASGKVTGPIAKVVVDGTAKLPSGTFDAPVSKGGSMFKFPFTNLSAPFRFTDGVLTVSGAKATLFSGEMTASGKVFVKETPIRFGFDTRVKSLQTQEFLGLNTTMKNVLQGGLDMSFVATGTTVGLNSLNGDSAMNMASGSYKAPPVAAQIFNALSTPQLTSGVIKSLQGHFEFKNGRMNSDDLLFKSPYGQLGYKGSVGLDTTLDGTANLVLPREICQSSKVLRDLVGNQPTLEIPVGVRGSLLSPGIDLRLDKLLKKAAENKAKDALMDVLTGGKKPQTQETASGTAAPAPQKKPSIGDLLGGDLGKILGGKKQPEPSPAPTPAPAPAPVSPSVATAAAPVPAPTPPPAPASAPVSPQKQIKQELKTLEKDLKKLFKFK
ncbi:MAG TPA: AsmA-like C-terminal region-containing protein [Candidatus Ozemobacteraceae bacterium]|nr:AsmA-like C-terminal region-containing protein [Candidatus Ozemobacteraceae bacterium]